jgi:hypothetical protein
MLSWFTSLAIYDKVMIIGFYLLGIILVTLWARFIARRYPAKRLPFDTLFSHNQGIENKENTTSSCCKDDKHQKAKKRCVIWSLLGKCLNNVKENYIRYSTNNKGDNQNHPSRWCHASRTILMMFSQRHIGHIVSSLRRAVNQSGKEPNGLRLFEI